MEIIDTYQIFPYVLITSAVYGFFVFAVVNTILEHKNKIPSYLICLAFIGARFLTYVLKANLPIAYVLFLFPVTLIAFIIITLLCYSDKTLRKVMAVLCGFLTYFFVISLGVIVGDMIIPEQIAQVEEELSVISDSVLFTYVFSESWDFFCAFITAFLIKLLQNKAHVRVNSSDKYAFLLLFPVSHLLLFVIAYVGWAYFVLMSDSQAGFFYAFFAVTLIAFVVDIVTFFVAEKMEKTDIQNKLYEKQLLQNRLDYNEVTFINKNKEELRKIRHDMSNILLTVKSLVETDKNDEAISILNSATDDLSSIEGVPICSDSTLNALLSIKKQQAEKQGINLSVDIEEDFGIKINNYDICRIIGNLLDNAVEAAGETRDKFVKIKIRISENTFFIKTENSCASTVKKIYKRKDRGNGQKIIWEIVKKHNGNFTFKSLNGIYRTETTLINASVEENV